MAQKAISALSTGSALSGTEVIPLVQSGVTVKRPVSDFQPSDADLTAIAALSTTAYGRSLLTQSAAVSLTTGAIDSTTNLDSMYAFSLQPLSVGSSVTGMPTSSKTWEGFCKATGTRSSGKLEIYLREVDSTDHDKGLYILSVVNGTRDTNFQLLTTKTYNDTLYAMLGSALSTSQTQQLLQGGPRGLLYTHVSGSSFSVGIGTIGDSTFADTLSILSALTKTNSAWAVGTAAGGKLSAAAMANSTMYGIYAIKRVDTGVTDVGFDVSLTTPTLPTNYTLYRRIGYFLTDGSANILKIIQTPNTREFRLDVKISDIASGIPASTNRITVTSSAPPNAQAILDLTVLSGSGSYQYFDIGPLSRTDAAASSSNYVYKTINVAQSSGEIPIPTDGSRQYYYRVSDVTAGGTVQALLAGWIDNI